MVKLTKENLRRFSISVADANANHLTLEDLRGITEVIANKKYRIMISNGFNNDGSRNRISETFNGTLIQAVARKKEILIELEEKSVNADANSTFEVFATMYCNYLEEKVHNNQLELSTYEGYYSLLQSKIIPYFKKMVLKDINERDVEKWIKQLSVTKSQNGTFIHPTTIAHAYKVLNNMFNYAKLDRILRENPCDFVRKKPTEQPEEKEFFTLEEMDYIKELLSTANIRLKTAVFLTMDTGCRREEIIGLKWEDIDFDNNKIDINKAVVTTHGKTPISKGHVLEKGVKSKNSKRKISVPSICMDLLKQYRNFKRDSGLKVKDNDYVFTNWDSNKVWDLNRFTAEWNSFRKEHNITKKVALHGLRHSTATFLLSTGIPKKDVAKHLGHTPEVLDRIYTHSDEKDDEKLVSVLEKEFYKDKEINKNDIKKTNVSLPTISIISIIAGYVDNDYKENNYKALDTLTNDNITEDNINKYLNSCQSYLLSLYPILNIFTDENAIPNESVFYERANEFIKFIGNECDVSIPTNGIDIIKKDYEINSI